MFAERDYVLIVLQSSNGNRATNEECRDVQKRDAEKSAQHYEEERHIVRGIEEKTHQVIEEKLSI